MTRRLGFAFVVAALLVLAACQTADPNGNGNGNGTAPPPGRADFDAAAEGIAGTGESIVTGLMSDPAFLAMGSFAPPPVFSAPPVEILGGLAAALAPLDANELPRGIVEYDPLTGEWDPVGPALVLELRWSFVDFDDDERAAVLVIDWGPTIVVEDRFGDSFEVPTDDMSVTLTIDGDTVAAFDAEIVWYAGAACPDGVAEPTSVWVDGSMGTVATISLNDVSVTLLDTSLATSGEVVAAAGSDSIGVAWNVTLNGSVVRVDCFIEDVEVDSGSVSVTLFGESAGTRTSLGVNLDFDTIVFDPLDGELVSVDLDGSIDINGVSAVTFSGTLDDENENGIPGDNLVLVFADGETMTFEALLEEAFHATTSAVSRLLSLGR